MVTGVAKTTVEEGPDDAGPETIFALATGPGRAGIAVIRLSGPRALDALRQLRTGSADAQRSTPDHPPRHLHRLRLYDPTTGDALDDGMAVWFEAPASYTGEDVAELHVHGGPAVIAGTLGALGRMPGLRLAEPGEFTRRAFANGKLDLTEVEALADLLAAETERQRRQALANATGHQRRTHERWRTVVVRSMALVESELDFADEGDVAAAGLAAARELVSPVRTEVGHHLADGHRGEILREGFRVVLAGAPNAGKSSLLNALAKRDVAIVSPEAGTTRDVIEVRLDLDGVPVVVSDTAGIRPEARGIEAEGVRRAIDHSRAADLVIWLVDATYAEPHPPAEIAEAGVPVLAVLNKSDLVCHARPPAGLPVDTPRVSARTGLGLEKLVDLLAASARERVGMREPALITRVRHREALATVHAALGRFLEEPVEPAELRAEDLRLAAQALGRLTGRVDVEDVLDELFLTFCIGK